MAIQADINYSQTATFLRSYREMKRRSIYLKKFLQTDALFMFMGLELLCCSYHCGDRRRPVYIRKVLPKTM